MNMHWLLKMAEWARNPPSKKQVIIAGVAAAVVLMIVGVEWLGLWPDWARVQHVPRVPKGY